MCVTKDSAEDVLILYVNGKQHCVTNPDPEDTLLQFLRDACNLKGTKLGCAEGGCGACTVMVSSYSRAEDKILHYSVNACLAPLVSMHGMAVTTVEGIGSTQTKLHAVQERLAKSHGSQCGFCTPGIVMSMYTLLRNYPQPTQEQMEKAFEGNLCRCTGYRPILEGFRSFTSSPCAMGEKCCKNGGPGCGGGLQEGGAGDAEERYDPSQEPIFPPELKLGKFDTEKRHYKGERVEWFRPTDLSTLLKLKQAHPAARLVCGNTEIGIEVKFKNQCYPVIIAPTHIAELNAVEPSATGITFGASVTLSKLDETLQRQIDVLPEHETRIYTEIVEMLRWFAGHQIRNVSSIAGNLMTASPISDLNPLYLAAGVTIKVTSLERGMREIKLDDHFFISYRKIAVADDEILMSVHIPRTSQAEFFVGYKQAHRKEDDIAIVNAGIRVQFDETFNKVVEMSLAFGGMAPITKACPKTSKALVGRAWNEKLLEEAISCLKEDLPLGPGAPGGMISYRRTLTISFFYKFYLSVRQRLAELRNSETLAPVDTSATQRLERGTTKSIQVYQEEREGAGECWKAIPHKSAELQCTGEAQYADDLPSYRDELYMALVMSTVPHGKVTSLDVSEALASVGVKDFVSVKDVRGKNEYGLVGDELVFSSQTVTCVGQVIGAVVADNQRHAQIAAKKVKVGYKPLPALLTIEDAIKAKSFYLDTPRKLLKGDVDVAFSQVETILTGEVRMGGQEHFYLETHGSICVPRENGEMEVFSSTQNPTQIQFELSSVLAVPTNRINVRVKRMGGGFGGKETRATLVTMPLAVAAQKLKVPVRCMLDRDEDMMITGTRHSFLGKYKVGFNSDGRIIALDIELYSNGGNTLDLSKSVLERALFSIDNAYNFPNLRVQGHVCKTNIPSNTAFRGFGGPQGMFVVEHIMSEISTNLKIPDSQLREMHLFKEGELTHYGQPVVNCNVEKCWNQVIFDSNYEERRETVTQYNREHRWRKRGICALPTKFGISFTAPFLNQAGALVHIYRDGNVLLTHAGTEMGQGLHTKMIQVASQALGVPSEKIYVMETSTSTVPNTSPTAASTGSDLNGGAVLDACMELNKRLEPVKSAKPDGSWEEWIQTAYFSRVSLSATGFYKTPDLGMNWETSKGTPFAYFTYGAAVSEVEIDCLTGDHQILRTDIVMDVGKSINPAIDIGQVEGGFVQGYGLFCLEQLKLMSGKGHLLTRGPGAYKIPGFGNIPQEFNVKLLKDAPNVKAVYSSKGVGEPPLFLSASVFFAIKSAIKAAREDAGRTLNFRLDSPCTPERIRMSCADSLTDQFSTGDDTTIPASSFFVEP